MNQILRRVQIPDLLFFSLVIALASLGLVMVYSSSSVEALSQFGDSAYYLRRQALFMLMGFAVMFFIGNTDYRAWVERGTLILGLSVATLLLVFVPGFGLRSGIAVRWLSIGGIKMQPAEFAKVAAVIYLSAVLSRQKEGKLRSLTRGLLPLLTVTAFLAGLLLIQPDFGNAVVLSLVAGTLIFLAGCPVAYLLGAVLTAAPLAWYLITSSTYRRKRLLAFLDPWSDPQNTSYQIVQSFTAFYSGGWWGTGLGNSREKLFYLPKVHTDFIGSVIGEELGFMGIVVVCVAFLWLVMRGFRIASRAPDREGFLLAAGCSSLIGLQSLFNFCVIMGLVPNKGLPLPFISHGGSSLLATFVACGLIQSVARVSDPAATPLSVQHAH